MPPNFSKQIFQSTTSSMSQRTKSNALYIALGITACGAMLKVAYETYTRSKSSSSSSDDDDDIPVATNHESMALLQPLFENAAQQAKLIIPSLNTTDQLMVYGLFKQASVGNFDKDTTTNPPPNRLNMVAYKKYEAWKKFNGMPQHFAMMKYVEVVEHFALQHSENNINNASASAGGQDAVLNMMDDSDIVYDSDDSSSGGLSLSDEGNSERYEDYSYDINNDDTPKSKSNLGQTYGHDLSFAAKQSTLGGSASGSDESLPLSFEDLADGEKPTILQAVTWQNAKLLNQIIYGADADLDNVEGNENKSHKLDAEIVNQRDELGQSALHMAADKGDPQIISILLSAGADPNAIDHEGISVLEAAVIGGNVHAVKLLLDAGADPDHEDMEGDTPRNCAEDDDNDEMKVLLRNAKRLDGKEIEGEHGLGDVDSNEYEKVDNTSFDESTASC
jgi:acyl-CoA-binding protein